mgnify:CR=1 FL=1
MTDYQAEEVATTVMIGVFAFVCGALWLGAGVAMLWAIVTVIR